MAATYQGDDPDLPTGVTGASILRLDQGVTNAHTQWGRLRRIVDGRMRRLGLTQASLYASGGPSVSWMTKLGSGEGPPSTRQAAMLAKLDYGLQWTSGTAWSLVAEDRSDWSEDMLEDEERQLVDLASPNSTFGWMVEKALDAMPEDDAAAMRQKISDLMGFARASRAKTASRRE